jgi:hypothetical protein
MQNAGASALPDAAKYPRDSHSGYHLDSMAWGSKLLASSMRNVKDEFVRASRESVQSLKL